MQQAPAVHRVAQPLQTTDCTNCPPSNSPATLTCPDRFQELEEALTLAEEHLSQDQEQSAEDLRQQLKQLQADLQSKAVSAEQLEQELQNKEAARQQAADELSVALEQQISVQVSQAVLMPPLPQPLDLVLGRCFATACSELATCMQYRPSVQPQSLIIAQSNLSNALLHPTCQMHYVTIYANISMHFRKKLSYPSDCSSQCMLLLTGADRCQAAGQLIPAATGAAAVQGQPGSASLRSQAAAAESRRSCSRR